MIFVVQPYAFWPGHYRAYLRALANPAQFHIYVDNEDFGLPNGFRLRPFASEPQKSILRFAASRLVNGLRAIWALKRRANYSSDVIHLLELEPVSFLFHEAITRRSAKHMLLTVHAVQSAKSDGAVDRGLRALHGFLREKALRRALAAGYTIVVHSETHRQALIAGYALRNANIMHIPYPCPLPKVQKARSLVRRNLLIYGIIREDKGIYEFLRDNQFAELEITVAGRVFDRRVLSVARRNVRILDRYLSDGERDSLFAQHDFLLLPYATSYTGGAGPLKDSLAYGVPVICSDIPIFREVVDTNGTGVVYSNPGQLKSIVMSITPDDYKQMSSRCIAYAEANNWNTLRDRYFDIYQKLGVGGGVVA